eukprot:8931090-Lingulodinium_polyedra.AAC.1
MALTVDKTKQLFLQVAGRGFYMGGPMSGTGVFIELQVSGGRRERVGRSMVTKRIPQGSGTMRGARARGGRA